MVVQASAQSVPARSCGSIIEALPISNPSLESLRVLHVLKFVLSNSSVELCRASEQV